MKPIIFYVDDEPHNLTVFEAALPEAWTIKTFDSPLKALEALESDKPWIIVSDQRMPGMSGVSFLELAKKIVPNAIRIIVTGYSDENLVVESVRKAQVFDYIRKPWEPDDLENSLNRAIEFYKTSEEARLLNEALKLREMELKDQTLNLLKTSSELEKANRREQEMRKELECWVPPFVLWAVQDEKMKFPMKKDIVGITFDIINSSRVHDLKIQGKSLRSTIIQAFSEAIIKHGGWRESHSGDSAYGHFGLVDQNNNPAEAAFAVAREFRVAMRSLSSVNNVSFECGIAVHIAKDSIVDVHTVQLNTPRGIVTQKSFDTTSSGIDLLHRMEKLAHELPGTNIILSQDLVDKLTDKPKNLIDLGEQTLKGQKRPVHLLLLPSDKVTQEDINKLIQSKSTKVA